MTRGGYANGAERVQLLLRAGAITLSRLALNTARRFAYPFAPALSRGLGVPLSAMTLLLAANQASSLLGLVAGPMADRYGYRRMMTTGLLLLSLGMLAGWIWPTYGMVGLAIFLAGAGKSVFDPAMQAWVGQRVPFRRRGLVIGVLEFSWAGSTLLGIPLMGCVISRTDWSGPFLVMAVAGALSLASILLVLPAGAPGGVGTPGTGKLWKTIAATPSAWGIMGFAFCFSLANDCLFVVYGAWVEKAFGMGVVAIGLGTGVIGVAELCGEAAIALFGDRIGLKRVVVCGTVLTGAGYLVLPLLAGSLKLCFSGLFLIFMCFEFAIVATLSFATELLPQARATMMSALLGAAAGGRIVGALMGGLLWGRFGITGVTTVAAAGCALALTCLLPVRLSAARSAVDGEV
jgi:DHA1 family inner membrane transport protein